MPMGNRFIGSDVDPGGPEHAQNDGMVEPLTPLDKIPLGFILTFGFKQRIRSNNS